VLLVYSCDKLFHKCDVLSVHTVRRRPLTCLRCADPVISLWCSRRFTEARNQFFLRNSSIILLAPVSQFTLGLLFDIILFTNVQWQHRRHRQVLYVCHVGNWAFWQQLVKNAKPLNGTSDWQNIKRGHPEYMLLCVRKILPICGCYCRMFSYLTFFWTQHTYAVAKQCWNNDIFMVLSSQPRPLPSKFTQLTWWSRSNATWWCCSE